MVSFPFTSLKHILNITNEFPHSCFLSVFPGLLQIQVWVKRISFYLFSPYFSFRKCISSYAKKLVKNTERKQKCTEFLFGPNIHPQSALVSRRSGHQDCSKHQTKSVQSHDGKPDLDSYKSSSTNNFLLIAPSKRNRPVSAPTGQLR